ncbi:MAG: hypothetical protein JXP37_01955 [Coriobacteriia bacterium]|nr:hypothetical protein [Coriobacteriia bacterium]
MPFVQGMAIAGVVAILLVVLAMPIGARASARAGVLFLRVSLIGVIAAFAGLALWGSASGDLARFNARMGVSSWLQMGAFFGIIYMTGYRFVASYLADKGAGAARTPSGGDTTTREGGPDA